MPASGHSARIYATSDGLAGAVADFLADGFAKGAPALLVVTPEHRERILELLGDGPRTLRILDAHALVADGAPSAPAFEHAIGSVLDELSEEFPNRPVRIFGEAVDVLMERGDHDGAIALEELWNSLAWSRRFVLLCGYRCDRFDGEAGAAALPEVRRTHSHVGSV